MLKPSTIKYIKVAKQNKFGSRNMRKRIYLGLIYYRCLGFIIGTDDRDCYYIIHGATSNKKVGWG